MGRFQLNQNSKLPLFSVFAVVPFNCCVYSCKPFVVIKTVETFIPNKICRRCNNNERPTGINTTIEWDDGEN